MTGPRRLLFVCERLDYTGAATYTVELGSVLASQGRRVEVLTGGGRLLDTLRERGIEVHVARRNFFASRKLLEFLREFDADLVHVSSLRSLPFARRFLARLGKPVVVTVHTRPGEAASRALATHADVTGFVVVDEEIRETLVNEIGVAKSDVRVIRRGVDLQELSGEDDTFWSDAKGRIPVVGSIGRLTAEKGQAIFLRAARKVIDAGVEAHWAVVGDGPDERRLRALASELGVDRQTTFSPHVLSRRDLFRPFDLVVLPVEKRGVSVTAIEAMAARKPLIANGVGRMLEIVQDGVTGHLVRAGSVDELAAKILELLRAPEEMKALGLRAREWIERSFSLPPMVDATLEFYAEVLGRVEEGRVLDSRRKR